MRCPSLLDRIFCSTWTARWSPGEELRAQFPARHTDFREAAPPAPGAVLAGYAPYLAEGRWTFGLFDMWCPRAKLAKHGSHIPCWDSCRVNPLRWRGVVFGRTLRECYWFGLRQTRWARAVHAANLGREYVLPVASVGRHGYLSEIKALCWLTFLLGCVCSCGVGQVFSLCGNIGFNFAAPFTCNARRKMRRRWSLPPAFGLPPAIDDWLVHFICFYCSSYQEMRELAVRGVDGPGLHVLDVSPGSFVGAPGAAVAVAARERAVAAMLAHPPRYFAARPPPSNDVGAPKAALLGVQQGVAASLAGAAAALLPGHHRRADSAASSAELGWCMHCLDAPEQAEMVRGGGGGLERTRSLPSLELVAHAPTLERAWSIGH